MPETQEIPKGGTYGHLLRELRKGAKLTQRELAIKAGLAPSTYGNVEAYPHRVVSRLKVERLLRELQASERDVELVLAAYELAPASAYAEAQREKWAKLNEQRRAARKVGPLEQAVLRLLLLRQGEGDRCDCAEASAIAPAFTCELCGVIRALGLGESWNEASSSGGSLERRASELGADNAPDPSTDSSQAVDESEFG